MSNWKDKLENRRPKPYSRGRDNRRTHQGGSQHGSQDTGSSGYTTPLCEYCGDDISCGDDLCSEKERFYHKDCIRKRIPWCKEAVRKFNACFQSNRQVIPIGIHVSYLYGLVEENAKNKRSKKEKRDKKVEELLRIVSAFLNSKAGTIFIHLVGLKTDDNFTGAFDEFADAKLNKLIHDGRLFTDVYKKERLCKIEQLGHFNDILVLYVTGTSSLTTYDFKTKITLDDSIVDPSHENIHKILKDKKEFPQRFHTLNEVKFAEDIKRLQESRSVQVKSNFFDSKDDDTILQSIFNKLRYLEYLSGFTKLDTGGSYLFGVSEQDISKRDYKSKVLRTQPIDLENQEQLSDQIIRKTKEAILVCDYDGNIQNDDIVQVNFIPSFNDDRKVVVHICTRSVNGIVFYDKSGPLAYRYDRKKGTVERIQLQKWFDLMSGKQLIANSAEN